jgi:quercetin dioxygenase-like cupin family protein
MARDPIDLTGPAEVVLPCRELMPTLEFFVGTLGFRIETIFPAEAPTVASLSGYGTRLRLEPGSGDPGHLRLVCRGRDAGRVLTAPNGTRVALVADDPPLEVPPLVASFTLSHAGELPSMDVGRAGMRYRDLIPGRQGGRFIASHIAIPAGGAVADWVHFHNIRFQLIFCRRGWVRVLYEDQGEPIVLAAGDCVLQPPRIRHRVLEASPGLEVVEVGCPALHETIADHGLVLPTGRNLPERDFGGQTFVHHVAAATPWQAFGNTGFERRATGLNEATRGVADACVLRPQGASGIEFPAHHGELLFGFVLEGAALLHHAGTHALPAASAFTIPPGTGWSLAECEPGFRLLTVVAPGEAGGLPGGGT